MSLRNKTMPVAAIVFMLIATDGVAQMLVDPNNGKYMGNLSNNQYEKKSYHRL